MREGFSTSRFQNEILEVVDAIELAIEYIEGVDTNRLKIRDIVRQRLSDKKLLLLNASSEASSQLDAPGKL